MITLNIIMMGFFTCVILGTILFTFAQYCDNLLDYISGVVLFCAVLTLLSILFCLVGMMVCRFIN